jgi:23S rRNA (uracil1939-C5)-methyltransferase
MGASGKERFTMKPENRLEKKPKAPVYPGGISAGKKRCPHFGKCGGCELLSLSYEEQLRRKETFVKEQLSSFCRLEPIVGMENPEHYRNKVHAVFDRDKKGNTISGVYEAGSHKVVPVDSCLLDDERADAIIVTIRSLLKSFKIKTYDEDTDYGLLRHVLIRTGHVSGQILVVLVTVSPVFPSRNNFVKALRARHPEITTIVQNINDQSTSMVLGKRDITLYGKGYIEDTLCGKTFRISPQSFYQINSVQTEKLYRRALDYAKLTGKETVLDAYCGIGTIGIIASDRAKRVIGVELNPEAVKDAQKNARANEVKNIEFYQNDAGKFMKNMAAQGEQLDVLFMDPPRSGSSREFLDAVGTLQPKKIVYVSCDVTTQVRDLKILEEKGYHAVRGVGVDMFPMTEKAESVVLLQRNN